MARHFDVTRRTIERIENVHVSPTALVDFEGIRYAMPAGACGIPATLYLYTDRVRIVTSGGRFEAAQSPLPRGGAHQLQQGQRAEQLAAVAGTRKHLYFMRERSTGEAYPTELIHARPHIHTWKGDVERLFMLLEELGETASASTSPPSAGSTASSPPAPSTRT